MLAAFEFFNSRLEHFDTSAIAGHHGTTQTKILPPYKIPRTYTEPPSIIHRNLVTEEHTRINAITDSEVRTWQGWETQDQLLFSTQSHILSHI